MNNSTKNIPTIKKILYKENYGHINFINNSKKRKFLEDCINLFEIYNGNYNFFINLDNNIKLKKLFINIIDEYIYFLLIENDFLKISTFMNYFFNNLVLEFIENNYSCKKVFLQLIDSFLQHFKDIIHFELTTYFNFGNIKRFLNKLFKNKSNYENIKDLDTLINIFTNITKFELNITKNEVYSLSIYTIDFYIKYIAIISKENN